MAVTKKRKSILGGIAENKIKDFDPEGSGYDYQTALEYGLKPDENNHWPSRVPQTGLILKGKKHKTFYKTVEADAKLGYVITRGSDGRYYSAKKQSVR